jgi:hypothetical protein
LQGAGLPIFTTSTNTDVTTSNMLFRTRADDSRMLSGLAQFATTDLGKSKIALFQGDPGVASRVTAFTTALTQAGKAPVTTVIQVAGGAISDSAKVLISSQPDAIGAFGTPTQIAQLLRELRGQNYNGLLIYPDADDQTFVTAVPDNLRSGIVGRRCRQLGREFDHDGQCPIRARLRCYLRHHADSPQRCGLRRCGCDHYRHCPQRHCTSADYERLVGAASCRVAPGSLQRSVGRQRTQRRCDSVHDQRFWRTDPQRPV